MTNLMPRTNLEQGSDRAMYGRRYRDGNKSHYGPRIARQIERLDCYRRAVEQMTDQERITLDTAASMLIEKIPGLGPLGALEVLACVGMHLYNRWINQETIKMLKEE